MAEQLTKTQAIAFSENKCWEGWSHREIAEFQIMQDKLCMDFSAFHEAVEKTVGRPVYTHEFGMNRDGLIKEIFEGAPAPTFEDILSMIPEEKRLLVMA